VSTHEEGPSLRSWMSTLEAAGQIRRIGAEVDWDQEIGAIARVNMALAGPALLFENIAGYHDTRCTRLLTCGVGNRTQVCLLLGLPPDTDDPALVRHLKDVFRRPMAPRLVATGPVKRHVVRGAEIDLGQFPVPRWHHTDGGRYIDTFCGVVTRDPETGRTNVGLYRGQVLGRDRIGKLLLATQHGGSDLIRHRQARTPMPVAVVHGWHDVLPFCAASPFPGSVCEWDMMGAILRRPVELVRCETVPLEVPATAEIVVEGTIAPDPATFEPEGPFAEYPGYVGGHATPKPVLRVTAITHRSDPILRGTLEGARPGFPSENALINAYARSAIAWNVLEDAGVVGVTDVWMPPIATGTNIVVQIRKAYRGHAQQVASALWGTGAAQWFYKNVMVVEEDIDVRDPAALDWAFAYRVNAGAGQLLTFGPTFGSVLDPSMPREEANPAKYGSGKWTRVLVDATRSWEFEPNPDWGGRRFPPVNTVPPELERKVRERWNEYAIGLPYLTDAQREQLTFERLSRTFPEV